MRNSSSCTRRQSMPGSAPVTDAQADLTHYPQRPLISTVPPTARVPRIGEQLPPTTLHRSRIRTTEAGRKKCSISARHVGGRTLARNLPRSSPRSDVRRKREEEEEGAEGDSNTCEMQRVACSSPRIVCDEKNDVAGKMSFRFIHFDVNSDQKFHRVHVSRNLIFNSREEGQKFSLDLPCVFV
ncbi:PREDICTED: uncharacterized protein LOC106747406 [Dinoponera quadriceps]|uniref:Uncharacterized protein LOC106747406 n=1 Tax=Dinoponera quadriceps TaxID=609295 RepID=A0A6P3XPP7_DINQU|nr:PREDICTED: uncharacterized protein LOC106747406 [Dinoponera quadriceps]